jgi:quercetin dioxygenase-like cupin family protein
MQTRRLPIWIAAFVLAAAPLCSLAQDLEQRKEWRRVDLSGAPGMEVIVSFAEYPPGQGIPQHLHHGIEATYVIEGASVQFADQSIVELKAGAPVMALRDALHSGFTVVGDKTLKVFLVHVVDKEKPLYDAMAQ